MILIMSSFGADLICGGSDTSVQNQWTAEVRIIFNGELFFIADQPLLVDCSLKGLEEGAQTGGFRRILMSEMHICPLFLKLLSYRSNLRSCGEIMFYKNVFIIQVT